MNLPGWLLALARTMLVITVPVILLVTPLYLFITPTFVHSEYARADFPPADRFTPAERTRLSDVTVRYVRGWEMRTTLEDLRTDSGEVAYRPDEVQHLEDVQIVMRGFFVAHQVALGLAILALAVLWLSPRRNIIPFALRQGIWVIGILIVLVVAFSFVDFNTFFTRFHQLFFTEGSWVFYAEDTLIQLYPLPFWSDAVMKVGFAILAEVGLLYVLTLVLDHRTWFRGA